MNVLEIKKLKLHSFIVSEFFVRCRRTYVLNNYIFLRAQVYDQIVFKDPRFRFITI